MKDEGAGISLAPAYLWTLLPGNGPNSASTFVQVVRALERSRYHCALEAEAL